MARLFTLNDRKISYHALAGVDPLRLDRRGEPAGAAEAWVASIVPFSTSERAKLRYALIATPGADVMVGARHLGAGTSGVSEIFDRDHLLLGDAELIWSVDSVPAPVLGDARNEPCPICCRPFAEGGHASSMRCPRCGARACNLCWSGAPRGVCQTPGCEQPVATDRDLWRPLPTDFVTWEGDE